MQDALVGHHLGQHFAHLEQFFGRDHGLLGAHVAQIAAGIVATQDFELLFVCGIAHFDLQEEAVELRFGETIGAFLLHGVLCRDDQIARVEPAGVAVEGHLSFLHHFE